MKKQARQSKAPTGGRIPSSVVWILATCLAFIVLLRWGVHWRHQNQAELLGDQKFQAQWSVSDTQMKEINRLHGVHVGRYAPLVTASESSRSTVRTLIEAKRPDAEIERAISQANADADRCWTEELSYIRTVADIMAKENGAKFRTSYESRYASREKDALGVLKLPHKQPH